MQRYFTSDLHLGHANIINHCDRPFSSVEEMNQVLIENWNQTVRENDIMFFLGDLGHFADEDQLEKWLDKLNGRVVFIEGNHDKPDRYTTGLNTHQYYILSSGDQESCLTHDPVKAPRFWDGWVIHGHHHNNDLDKYPLVHPENRTVNVSVELTDYKPIEEGKLVKLIDTEEKLYCLNHNISV